MSDLIFEWDGHKSNANQKKHGISFEEARSVFFDESARLISDPDHSNQEERFFVLLGMSIRLRVLVVAHCYRENEDAIRIISARKATLAERREYMRWLA